MRGRFTALLAGLLVLAPLAAAGPSATGEPTEEDAYCELERNGTSRDRPTIALARANGEWWRPVGPDEPVGPARVTVCEGEHWDGQDRVRGDAQNEDDCVGRSDGNLAYFQCADPNAHPGVQVLAPLGARASTVAHDTGAAAAYGALRASGVGTLAVFGMACVAGAPEPGHAAGPDACQGTAHVTVGAYAVDQTPFQMNLWWVVVDTVRPTGPDVSDADCTAEEYEESDRRWHQPCARDNTAITVEVLL